MPVNYRLASVTESDLRGTALAVTAISFDADGVRVRKDDSDGTTLYAGPVEQTIGPGGTATAEYFDDASGTTLASFYTARAEVVEAGLTRSFTDTPLAGMGGTPLRLRSGQAWAVRWQLWLSVPVTDTYTFAVFADDGFSFNGNGLSLSSGTTRAPITTETSSGVVMTPGNVYNFSLAYMNYTTATRHWALDR
ncbi:MAG TPA: PA14 domain-containing protein [Thermoflexales bacterium]|nr:hypothetical protein [Anaerolineae bacterium]HQZ55123.1 PA14 domain-containing protein [Thermoflexales bacterium]HRA52716.1 PA14 domain-containing protein [Thermoflexales bacterium]